MKMIAHRLKEPSTWAAIFTALAALGLNLDPGLIQNITAAGAGVAGLAAFFIPENASE